MIENIDHVVIFITNMEKSIEFYTDILGLDILYQSPEYTSINVIGGTTIGLHISQKVAGVDSEMATTQVSFGVSDINKAHSWLKDQGVRITRDVEEIAPGKFMFNFADLDGNQLSCYENRS